MAESVGWKLQQARLARRLEIEDVAELFGDQAAGGGERLVAVAELAEHPLPTVFAFVVFLLVRLQGTRAPRSRWELERAAQTLYRDPRGLRCPP